MYEPKGFESSGGRFMGFLLHSWVLALTHIDTNVGCSDLKYANITCHVDFDGVLCYFVYIVGIGILYRRSCTKAFKAQIYNRTFLQR